MTRIDLYTAHSLDRNRPCDELAQHLTAQLDAIDQYDTVTRGRVETARHILGDQQRRDAYNGLLADPAGYIDEQILASIATGASSAPTLPPGGAAPQWAPIQQQDPTAPQAQPAAGQPHQAQQAVLTQVVVVPDGIMPKIECWADHWTVEVQDNGATLVLIGTGKGSAARKLARKSGSGSDNSFIAGAIGGAILP